MEKTAFKVEGMSCEHCAGAVKKAVSALPGIKSVTVDLKEGMVTVEHDPAQSPIEAIKTQIEDQGYDVP